MMESALVWDAAKEAPSRGAKCRGYLPILSRELVSDSLEEI